MSLRLPMPKVWLMALSYSLLAQTKESADFVLINAVEGKCEMDGHVKKRLTKADVGGKTLRVDDKVRCDEGTLSLGFTTIDPSPKDSWTTVRRASLPPTGPLARPVDDYFKLGGATRAGSFAWVYSPPGGSPGSAVWPSNFVIRWIPQGATGNISVGIRDERGSPIWPPGKDQRATVAAAAGELMAPEMRDALLAYRASGRSGPMTLILVNPEGDESSVKFSIISAEQEDALRRQLGDCDGQSGLIRYICRAYYFRQLALYTEAAGEYDAALKDFAPESVDLVLHAIAAHRLTGNYRREQILTRQLPAGVKAPE
jgi:hypothetical protein